MEHEASKSVKEQSKMELTIKTEVELAATSTAHIDIDFDLNHLKQEPRLSQCPKSEPAVLVKEEILMDSSQDGNEQQCVKGTTTPADACSGNEACGTASVSASLYVKQELEDMDIGPTMLQHMDIHHAINKNMSAGKEENTVDVYNEAMPDGGVKKESAEDKLIEHMRTSVTAGRTVAGPTHTGKRSHQCDVCDARFARSGGLSKHMRVHTSEKPYKCTTCDARFRESGNLTKHMRVHTSENPYKCTTCDARFRQKGKLTTHMRVHTGEKPYMCTTCYASFTDSGTLTIHMRVHTGEKPYQCTMCDAKFACSSKLTTHGSVHTGEKPYHCTTCYLSFAQRGTLTKHLRVHTGDKPYKCNDCGAKFATKYRLNKHMERLHPK